LNATLPVGRISGRVLSDDGKPMAEIQVMVQPQGPRERKSGELQTGFGNVQSAADGSFEIEMLPAGTYNLSAQPSRWRETAKSKSNGTARLEGVELAAGGNVTGLELRMPRAGSVRGTVIGPNGPIAGAQVTTYGNEKKFYGAEDTTDASGGFQIDSLNPGTVVLIASTQDLTTRPSAPIEIRSGETSDVELHLEPGGKVRISALDAQGKLTHAPYSIVDADGKVCRYFPVDWSDAENGDKGWTVGPIPVGTYTLKIGEGEHKVEREVHITAGAIEAVHVQFQ
jgi:hypothetical protein